MNMMFEKQVPPETTRKIEWIQFFTEELNKLESQLSLKQHEVMNRRAPILSGKEDATSRAELIEAEGELKKMQKKQEILVETVRCIKEEMHIPVGAFEILKDREVLVAKQLRDAYDLAEKNTGVPALTEDVAAKQAKLANIIAITEQLKSL